MGNVVFFDFDSTVVTKESLDEVIALALAGHPEQERMVREIEHITALGMEGKLAFTQSVSRRLKTLPLYRFHFEAIGQMLTDHITAGMPEVFEWLRNEGCAVYIVSGGFRECILPVARKLGVPPEHCISNEGNFGEDGLLTGINAKSHLWTDHGKAAALTHVIKNGKHSGKSALVGDGSNDLAAFAAGAVDYFCGFGANVARTAVREKAPAWASSTDELLEWLERILG